MEKTYFHFDYPRSHFEYFLDYYHVDGWIQNICQEVEVVTFETYQLAILPKKTFNKKELNTWNGTHYIVTRGMLISMRKEHTCINGGGGGGNPGPTGWPPAAEGWGIITMGWPCNMLSDLREPAKDCESPMNPLFISPPKNKQNEEIWFNIDSVESF